MNVMATLVKREFWEHRGLWIAPLAVASVFIVAILFASGTAHIQLDGMALHAFTNTTPEQRTGRFAVFVGVCTAIQMLVICVVVFFYLSDALYGERKDRSILFWKSLPVSDSYTVLSKLLVALFVAPLVALAVAVASSLICYGIASIKYNGSVFDSTISWDTLALIRVLLVMLIDMLVGALWYAPLAAYVLLVSGWAKRSVALWVALPPLAISIAEASFMNTQRFSDFISYRVFGLFHTMGIGAQNEIIIGSRAGAGESARISAALTKLDLSHVLLNIDLWLGLAAAVAMVLVAIRIRRYRDDTSG